MSTFVEDMQVALGEVAPHLAGLIHDPRCSWASWSAPRCISFEDFVLINRARHLVGARHGRPRTHCDRCSWAVFQSTDDKVGAQLNSDGCPHIGVEPC